MCTQFLSLTEREEKQQHTHNQHTQEQKFRNKNLLLWLFINLRCVFFALNFIRLYYAKLGYFILCSFRSNMRYHMGAKAFLFFYLRNKQERAGREERKIMCIKMLPRIHGLDLSVAKEENCDHEQEKKQ